MQHNSSLCQTNKVACFKSVFSYVSLALFFGMALLPAGALASDEKIVVGDWLAPDFWDYDNQLQAPQVFLQVRINGEAWAHQAALALVPVQIQRHVSQPLLFLNATGDASPLADGATVNDIGDWGTSASSAMDAIAREYWTKAELVVIANDYETALWATPLASFLKAPLLIDPDATVLTTLGTTEAILVGVDTAPTGVEGVMSLGSREDVWRFQLQVYQSKGILCDYIVLTNPTDVDSSAELLYPGLSPAAGILAAQRKAIIVTNDYTVDVDALKAFGSGTSEDAANYAKAEPAWKLVRQDVMAAAVFMQDMDHEPSYLAIVGDGLAVPDYYLDYHVQWKYWNASQHYAPSQGPYAILDPDWNWSIYQEEDIGVGRLVTSTFELLSNYLVRIGHYDRFLPGGAWSTAENEDIFDEALVIDGHRINQPDPGGPPWSADVPWPPAGEMKTAALAGGFNTTYIVSRNASVYNDTNPTTTTMLEMSVNSSLVLVNVHGTSPGGTLYYRIDKGKTDKDTGTFYTIEADKIREHSFTIPTVVSVVGCNLGTHARWGDAGDHLPVANLDMGAAAYVGNVARQSICYSEKAPYGPCAATQVYTWQNITSTPQPLGPAYAAAKWEGYETFRNDSSDQEDSDPYVMQLFGDPAFVLNHPTKAYPGTKTPELDLQVTTTGGKVKAVVTTTDPTSGGSLTPTVQMKLGDGETRDGTTVEFDHPKTDSLLEVTVVINGFADLVALLGIEGKGDSQDTDDDVAPGLVLTAACVLVAVVISRLRLPS